jgi:Ca-activated chloride channel family protein
MKRILFVLLPAIFLLLAFQPVKFHTVSGKIKDTDGNELASVTVAVKGTSTAALSAKDGTYRINVNDRNAILVFSAVGYISQEIKIKGKSTINVMMKAAATELQEVVVIGYGQKHKKDVLQQYNANLEAPLQGRIAGVHIQHEQGYYTDPVYEDFNTEDYDHITENGFLKVSGNPLSTFSIDVDAASYSNVRRYLNQGQLPPAGAVRIEEMINYFQYDYPQPKNDHPFSINTEISDAPWNKDHKLVLIGLQGKKIPTDNLPASNLVFLIDVSGSMQGPNRLPR